MFHIERPVIVMAILFVVALAISAIVHPYILKIALAKGLTDNPGERKLQKKPVPVTGGIVVFFGIVCSLCVFKTTVSQLNIFSTVCAMMIMLYVGTIDDMLDLSAWKKLLIELLVCVIILYGVRSLMVNWQGLFGIYHLSDFWAVPFTIFSMLGIINAMNLIDGVDGLSSGMCIFAFLAFSLFLFLSREYAYCALAVICAGALIPFFLHNVYGTATKMYLGDGGALMMGVSIATIVLDILKGRPFGYMGYVEDPSRFSLGCMCLAVLSVPVFDTLRVMLIRILHGHSPFHADKTHLHHYFIANGMSHLQTTFVEIALNAAVVAVWLFSYWKGASVQLQFWIVIALSVAVTCGPLLVMACFGRSGFTHTIKMN